MKRVLASGTLVALAFVHTFPLRAGAAAALRSPTPWDVGKGAGATLAVLLFLLLLTRAGARMREVWSLLPRRVVVPVLLALGAVHLLAAQEHGAKLVAALTWADAWRAGGATAGAIVLASAALLRRSNVAPWLADARPTFGSLVSAVGLGLGAAAGADAVHAAATPRPVPAPPALLVPRLEAPVRVDGELEDWPSRVARTGPFLRDGAAARPYVDARLAHRDGRLFLVLYAADDDLRTNGDFFHVVLRSGSVVREIDVFPDGSHTSGGLGRDLEMAVERDGTVDDPRDHDEEWIVEASVPLAALGVEDRSGAQVALRIYRCDDLRGEAAVKAPPCASTGDRTLQLE